ncbi:unnamed protein product [Closterium sp. Naga37s-1]|nr:unnamed protein product [Closterium sp. Naga37s-1]
MSWLALDDSSARDDLQRRMRVSCGCGQIRDCCFGRAAAVTSSLDNLRATTPCARLLFMAPVAIGSSGWRTTAAACAPLHYIACGGFCWCAPSPCHFGRPCGSICTAILGSWQVRGLLTSAASDAAPLQLRAYSVVTCERERLQPASAPGALARTSAAPGGARLLLLSAHCCYSWRPTAATPGGPLLLLLAAHGFLLPTEVLSPYTRWSLIKEHYSKTYSKGEC